MLNLRVGHHGTRQAKSKCFFLCVCVALNQLLLLLLITINFHMILFCRDSITFAEVGCRGPGADTSKRVKWEKNLSSEDLNKLIDANNFINQDGWLQQQPKI